MPLQNYMIAHKENKYFHPQKHIAHSIKISRGFLFWCNASINCTCHIMFQMIFVPICHFCGQATPPASSIPSCVCYTIVRSLILVHSSLLKWHNYVKSIHPVCFIYIQCHGDAPICQERNGILVPVNYLLYLVSSILPNRFNSLRPSNAYMRQ